ncbi:MAG TPA: FtsX-like permease family protein, partial [Thermoplasmata archaeon]|nr:FtsX-like permease family protein [Thermoplasmata archaeon]
MALLSSTDGVLLLILGLVALASAVLALRHRLAFRIALRNVRRGGSRSVILVLGLLVATTIISGSLVVGDTDNQLNLHYTYLALGHTDESIFNQTPTGDFTPFPYSVYNSVVGGVQSDRSVSGVTPMVLGSVQAFDRTSGVPQTNLHLVGVNGNQSANLGPFATDAGTSLSGPLPGQVLLDDQAASELNAAAGHTVDLYAIGTAPLTVQAIVQDNDRGAFLTAGLGSSGNVFVDLATAQSLLNVSGELNFLSVSNVGSVAGSVSSSDAVSAHLNATLAGDPAAKGLVVHESLKDGVSQAQQAGTSIETIFLVLGLFSIVAGAMLIVGIFVMLAEERKGEMGMLRAIGLTRRELVYIYYFEGLVYAAGSALAGTVLGVGVGFLMVYAFAFLLPSTGLTTSAILASFSVNPDSILISYVLGFLLTIVTVALASRRVSRLNIVRAIRDLPEPPTGLRTYTTFAYLGAAIAVLGGLLFAATFRGTSDVSYPLLGGSMLVGGIALVASRFVKNRWAFSFAGAGLLLWGGLEPLHSAVLGSNHTGGIFVVFVEGILLVFGALLLYVFNASALVQALLALAGGRRRGAPVARIALSYPGRQATRTTINLAIFSLVVFTLVTISTFSSTVTANLESTIQDQSGGYSFFGFSQRPIPNLPGQIEGNASLSGSFSEVVPLEAGGVDLVVPGYAMNPFGDVLYAGPTGGPSSSDLYRTNAFPFSQTLGGISAS